MNGKVNRPEWDDVPAKVAGKRRAAVAGKKWYELPKLANSISDRKISWPKGVFRFTSRGDAAQWWIDRMIVTD